MVNSGALAQAYLDCCHKNHSDKIAQVFDGQAHYLDGAAGQDLIIPELIHYVQRLHRVLPNIEFQLTDYALSSEDRLLIRWRLNPESVGSDVMNRLSPNGQDYTGMDYVQLAQPNSSACKVKTAQSYYDSPSQLIVDCLGDKQNQKPLSKHEVQMTAARLQQLLEQDKLYLDAQLRLKNLAEKLSITGHQLSQVINDYFDKNFNEFINSYRVNEAMELMATEVGKRYSLLDIALAAGFNSQAVFNPAFKKITSLTPSQFKKQLA